MSLKLDELRKRLLQQPLDAGFGAIGTATAEAESEPAAEASEPERQAAKPELKAVEPVRSPEPAVVKTMEVGAKDKPGAPKEATLTSLTGRPGLPGLSKGDGLVNPSQVIESVSKLFEQTRTFQVRFDELSQAIDVIDRLTESAGRLFTPLRSFHAQLLQLSASFESIRSFQMQLAELGRTFEPMKIVHDQLAQLMESIQSNLAQLVKALDPAKDFRDRIMTLARTLDQASELQANFGDLYSAFRSNNGATSDSVSRFDRDSRQSAAS